MTESEEHRLADLQRHGAETVAALHVRTQHVTGRHHRFIERAIREIGTPRTLYFVLAASIAWMLGNAVAHSRGLPSPDPPPFSGLQCAVSLLALVLTTMILSRQNRQSQALEARSQLDLQVSLLAEQKVAKLIQLVEELRVDLPMVKNREDPLAKEMQEAVDANAVVDAIQENLDAEHAKR